MSNDLVGLYAVKEQILKKIVILLTNVYCDVF